MNKIPYEKASGLILVQASINGIYGKFIFDTGANQLLLNNFIDSNNSDQSFHTITGELNTSEVRLNSFKLGSYTIKNLKAYSTDLSNIESHVGSRILGIIGAKLLDSELIYIDIKDKVLELYPREYLKKNKEHFNKPYKVVFENDVPIIRVDLGLEHYNFVLDTGSSISMIDDDLLERHASLLTKTEREFSLLTAKANRQINYYYSLKKLSLGENAITELELAVCDLDAINSSFDTEISGILSLDDLPFAAILLDYKNEVLYID